MGYNKIQDNFWIDEKVKNWDFKTRMIALYLLSNQHSISEGLYHLPLSYMAEDMCLKKEEILEGVNKLSADNFIKYDKDNSIILIINALKYQPLNNINHYKSALNKLEALPTSPLLQCFIEQAELYNPKFYSYLKAESKKKRFLKKGFSTRKSKGLTADRNKGLQTNSLDGLSTNKSNSQAPALSLSPTLTPAQAQIKTAAEKKEEAEFLEQINSDANLKKAAELASYLIELIAANNPRAAVPKKDSADRLFLKWTKEIEKLHRLGPLGAKAKENKGYSFAEIEAIISFSQQDQFWKNNILSAKKLRKQVIKLENKLKSSKFNAPSQKSNLLKELYLAAKGEENSNEEK